MCASECFCVHVADLKEWLPLQAHIKHTILYAPCVWKAGWKLSIHFPLKCDSNATKSWKLTSDDVRRDWLPMFDAMRRASIDADFTIWVVDETMKRAHFDGVLWKESQRELIMGYLVCLTGHYRPIWVDWMARDYTTLLDLLCRIIFS